MQWTGGMWRAPDCMVVCAILSRVPLATASLSCVRTGDGRYRSDTATQDTATRDCATREYQAYRAYLRIRRKGAVRVLYGTEGCHR